MFFIKLQQHKATPRKKKTSNFYPLHGNVKCRMAMSSAEDMLNISNFFFKIVEIQIFIAMFEISMKSAFMWVQTSLVLVQWLLRWYLKKKTN